MGLSEDSLFIILAILTVAIPVHPLAPGYESSLTGTARVDIPIDVLCQEQRLSGELIGEC